MKSLTCWLAIVLIGISFPSKSQHTFVQEWQAWFRYYHQNQLNDKYVLHVEIDERRVLNPSRQFQFFTHVHLHHRVKPWLDIAAGFNFNLTTAALNASLAVPELRPWQEVTLTKQFRNEIQFQFRYRLDERFVHNNNKTALMDGYHFNWRNRFRIQFSKPIVEFNDHRTLTMKLSDEVMLNCGDVPRLFDQNRLFASLEIKFNNQWSFESGYLNIVQPITDDVFYNRHVIRSTLHHRIGLK